MLNFRWTSEMTHQLTYSPVTSNSDCTLIQRLKFYAFLFCIRNRGWSPWWNICAKVRFWKSLPWNFFTTKLPFLGKHVYETKYTSQMKQYTCWNISLQKYGNLLVGTKMVQDLFKIFSFNTLLPFCGNKMQCKR